MRPGKGDAMIEWIKVSERLPEDDRMCAIWLYKAGIVTGNYNPSRGNWSINDDFEDVENRDVLCWAEVEPPPAEWIAAMGEERERMRATQEATC